MKRTLIYRWIPAAAIAASLITSVGFRSNLPATRELGRATARPNPFAGERLFIDPLSDARKSADQLRTRKPADAAMLDKIASQPQALWVAEWSGNPKTAVGAYVEQLTRVKALPVLVAYNIPARDCGWYSAGGARGAGAYRKWIRGFAEGLRGRKAVVILEPDALALQCESSKAEAEQMSLIRDAVDVLQKNGAHVYIDAGNPYWVKAEDMAARLQRAGVANATGFALNVSNFYPNADNVRYGERVSRLIGGKHFIVDTSRNGRGAKGAEWCNPTGRGLGTSPTAETDHPLVDAFLWIKRPGESDGTCEGGPRAGQWWADYAVGLAKRQSE